MSIHETLKAPSLMMLIASLVGCTPDPALSPPKNAEFVSVSINAPVDFTPHDINAVYRSKVCTRSVISLANGSKITRDGSHELTLTPAQPKAGNLYTAEIPINGGGWTICLICH